MIELTKLRELTLMPGALRYPHLSAASGLVCLGSTAYVVADDEQHLGVFSLDGSEPGRLIRLFEGELPASGPARKTRKPDLEALVLLPAFANFSHGAMLAMGSGSRTNRRRGALLGLDRLGLASTLQGGLEGTGVLPLIIDLSPLLSPLDKEFDEVNIEGAVVAGDELVLFQRGNRSAANAIVRFALAPVLGALERGLATTAEAAMAGAGETGRLRPDSIERLDLGAVDGVPLCFTDAAVLPDGEMVFTAIAEDTADAYHDGVCIGAAVGLLGSDGGLRGVWRLAQPYKVEGVQARRNGGNIHLLLVTDADDAKVPASLYSARLG